MKYAGLDTDKDNVFAHIVDEVKDVNQERTLNTETGFDRLALLLKDCQCVME